MYFFFHLITVFTSPYWVVQKWHYAFAMSAWSMKTVGFWPITSIPFGNNSLWGCPHFKLQFLTHSQLLLATRDTESGNQYYNGWVACRTCQSHWMRRAWQQKAELNVWVGGWEPSNKTPEGLEVWFWVLRGKKKSFLLERQRGVKLS